MSGGANHSIMPSREWTANKKGNIKLGINFTFP